MLYPCSKKKVLIVEDSKLQAQITADALGSHGYSVDVALSPEEALQKALGPDGPDLILMDIDLGERDDGAALAERIQQMKNLPVVFLTALSTREVVERVRSVTRYGYVLKGAPEHVLVSTVEMALELHEALSSAETYRRIVEDSLTEVYIFDPVTLKFLTVNRGARENLGYTEEELLTMTPLDLKPEFERQSFGRLLEPLLRGERERLVFETVHRRKDGSLYPVEVHLQLFGHGRDAAFVAFILDLTARKKMERELREREAALEAIMASAGDAVIMLDGLGRVTFWNPAAERLFGYSRREVLGRELHRVLLGDGERYRACEEAFHRFRTTGECPSAGSAKELKLRARDGRELYVELSLSALKFNGAWHAVGIARDITERKRAEEQLRLKEGQLRAMLEALPYPSFLIGRDRRIVALNRAGRELGASEGDYCWLAIYGLKALSPEQREAFLATGSPMPGTKCSFCRADEAMEKGRPENREVDLGRMVWDTWWVPVDDNVYLHYVADVTRYRRMEEKLRQQGEFLRLLLAALPVGVLIIDPASHRIEEANLEASAMMGAAPEDIAGRHCWQFFPHCSGQCPATGSNVEMERSERLLRREDGLEIPVLKTVRRLHTDSGEKLVEAFVDLSERKRLEEELYRMSVTDPLTGAYNRRYFVEMLEREVERARRTDRPFSLIMFDLDRFKSINDRFGHAAGDLVLKKTVATFKERLRKTDCLARWGGEEFVILLPETAVEGAAVLAEDLRRRLSEMDIPGVGRVTASFGVTGYRPGDTIDTITQRVDGMLYRAKENGRNCVWSGS